MPKVVFSKSLHHVDRNSRLFGGDALEEVARLKREPGKSMSIGGATLATSLAQNGLIDEFRSVRAPFSSDIARDRLLPPDNGITRFRPQERVFGEFAERTLHCSRVAFLTMLDECVPPLAAGASSASFIGTLMGLFSC